MTLKSKHYLTSEHCIATLHVYKVYVCTYVLHAYVRTYLHVKMVQLCWLTVFCVHRYSLGLM